eukprot:CAMPEP_0172854682 /NCGR_PEP_ID=MMETSP1075-20121228/58435_1 /TAXON_ID=2916 /ORGANISM="Ceratium fusus, Strain PA161109" /LENGTH=84 /DNA_ID=CAMNT_0013701395 /DNA_START=17 /DNA_END=267 /DNA_ORIENTATION=+
MTYDAAHTKSAHFYHNGKDVGITGPASKPMKTLPNSVQIGFMEGTKEWFTGYIDSSRLYAKSLSAEEVAALFDSERRPENFLIA